MSNEQNHMIDEDDLLRASITPGPNGWPLGYVYEVHRECFQYDKAPEHRVLWHGKVFILGAIRSDFGEREARA
jgi:hypothetical protein